MNQDKPEFYRSLANAEGIYAFRLPADVPTVRSLGLTLGIMTAWQAWEHDAPYDEQTLYEDAKEAVEVALNGMEIDRPSWFDRMFTEEYVRGCKAFTSYLARHPKVYRACASLVETKRITAATLAFAIAERVIVDLTPEKPLMFSWELLTSSITDIKVEGEG